MSAPIWEPIDNEAADLLSLVVNGSVDCPEAPAQAHRPDLCEECSDPIEDGECPHGRPLCDTCRLAGCWQCGHDHEADLADARAEAMRDHQEMRE